MWLPSVTLQQIQFICGYVLMYEITVRALSTPAYAVTDSRSSPTMPGSYLRSHYPKSQAKPTLTTAYFAAGFMRYLRVEYNKPGQETISYQQSEFTSTCTDSQYIQVISILSSKLLLSLINSDYFIHSSLCLLILQLHSFSASHFVIHSSFGK